jgi:anaerobic magnesium-protoporphyrin IX monomethyl ester cyclase
MKILFINPSVRPDSLLKLPNVGLAYVMTAAERAGFDFDVIDIDAHRFSEEKVGELIRNSKCDVVGVGTLVSCYGMMKKLFGVVRQYHPKATIVVGNTLGTSIPGTLLSKTAVDVCVVGEGELTFVDLIHALDEGRSLRTVPGIAFKENGEFVQNPQRPLVDDIDTIPFPSYDFFDMEIYLAASRHLVANPDGIPIPFDELVAFPVNVARGCAFHCNFCYHAFQDRKYRVRSADNVVAEMSHWKEKYGVNYVNFWDELTFFSQSETERFADALIEADLGIHWIASGRSELLVRKGRGVEIARKLKQAGCHGLGFSLETGNPEILASMNKANTVDEFIEQSHILHEANIDVYSGIIIGYPQESTKTIDDTFRVLTEARVYPSVGFLQLMPGTPMYQMAVDGGQIKDEEEYLLMMGDRQDIRVNMTQYEDEFLMGYATEKLLELNRTLKTGVEEDSLIKTKTYYAVKKKDDGRKTDNFMEEFGIAGEVSGDALRDSNWTGNPES